GRGAGQSRGAERRPPSPLASREGPRTASTRSRASTSVTRASTASGPSPTREGPGGERTSIASPTRNAARARVHTLGLLALALGLTGCAVLSSVIAARLGYRPADFDVEIEQA